MTTEFAPTPNVHPNHVSTGSGKVKLKTSNERSYLKSRRSHHRTEKRQTILNFLDKNLGGSSSSNIDHHHHHRDHHLGSSKGSLDKTPGSPTQRRRNISYASTAKSPSLDSSSSGLNAASDHSNLDGSFSQRDKQKHHHQQRSRWNPFVKKSSISEQPATTTSAATDSPTRDNNNSNSSGKSRSRRSANRQRLAEHLSQERRQQEEAAPQQQQQQQQQLNESYHTEESQQHQQILDRVLKSYPKHSCRNAEDHLMFATAELTTLQNKLHLPQATFKLLKIKLKDRLDAQEADEYLRKQHEEHIGGRIPQLSPKSQKSRRSKGPQVKRVVKTTTSSSIAATDNNDNHNHHHRRRPTSPTKSKSAPSSSAYKIRKNDELYGINNNESSKIGTIQEERGHRQQQNEQLYGEDALKDGSNSNSHRRSNSTSNSRSSAEDNSTTTPDSNRSLAVSTKSLVVPKQRPPSSHSLKVNPTDKDDTSRTTLEDDEDDDDDPAAAAVASLLKYVEEKFMEDGNGHRGTYTGPVDQQSGLPHGTAGKMEYNHSHNHKFDNYQGEWYKGLFTGSGTLLKTNGDVYHGQFMDGVYHGKGHYQYYHSSRHFSGRHVQGQRVEGTMTYKDGSIYKGQFYKGKRHGRGQYTFQDSSVYKGEFSEDKLHGIGQLTWPDGSKYIGEWLNGVRHGTGKEYKADGSLRFQGRWKDGNEVRD